MEVLRTANDRFQHLPGTRGGETILQRDILGAKNQKHTTIAAGGHFLQEDKGEQLATVVVDF